MERLLNKSMAYVQKNIQATTDELPMELLEYWTVEDVEDDNEDQWTIFMTAFLKRKSLSKKNNRFEIQTEELMRLFNDWQLLLNTALATRLSELEMKPLPAFNFEDIRNYQFDWTLK